MDEIKPTDAELAILDVLWNRGPSTVRDVYEELSGSRHIGYTTVLKFLQIMTDKGLVERDESERAHIYRARQSQQRTQTNLVSDLVSRAFGGSTQKLVLHALSSEPVSSEELHAIRALLDQMEGGQTDD